MFRNSKFQRTLLLLGGGLLLLSIFIGAALLTNNFLLEQPNRSISKTEYYLILGVFLAMFVGLFIVMTQPLLNQALPLIRSKNPAKSSGAVKSYEADLAFQQKSITALLSISETRGNFLPLDQVFHHALRVVQEVTGFNTVVIRLYDEKTQTFRIAAQQGMSLAMEKELAVSHITNPILGEASRSFWPVPINDLAAEDVSMIGISPTVSGFRSLVCIPLVSGEILIGTIELGSKMPHHWSQDELRWLALVGRAIGSIVHQVRLTEHLRDFAALQERSRLAQELHDGLVQLIGSINMWSQEAQEAFTAEDYPAIQVAISQIEALSSDAYASLREELLGLRDTFDSDRDLLSVIREYLSRFKRQWGIEVELITEDLKISQIISPAAEVQLLRVIQESMTNVRRHAQATKVTINILVDEKHLNIKIEDNGQGFQINEVEGNHLGLNIMRERIASVEGTIKLESEPGSGTKIQVEIPRHKTGIISRSVE